MVSRFCKTHQGHRLRTVLFLPLKRLPLISEAILAFVGFSSTVHHCHPAAEVGTSLSYESWLVVRVTVTRQHRNIVLTYLGVIWLFRRTDSARGDVALRWLLFGGTERKWEICWLEARSLYGTNFFLINIAKERFVRFSCLLTLYAFTMHSHSPFDGDLR